MSASSVPVAQRPASDSLLDMVADVVETRSEESWPSEWEVVYTGGLVNVRKHNNTGSEVVSTLRAGTVVLGFERGHWLKLSGIDGYMEIRVDPSGYLDGQYTELLRKREVTYKMADGDCDDCGDCGWHDIPDRAVCRHASRWLKQPEEALWFNDGCQVDPTKHVVASSTKKLGEDEEEEPEEQKEEKDEAKNGSADDARESENVTEALAGRRLKSGEAPHGGRHGATAEAGDPAEGTRQLAEESGGESWEQYAKRNNLVSICSTASYDPLMPFPVRTHTSVTSATTVTTMTTQSTLTIVKPWGTPSLFCFSVFRAHTKEEELVKEACRLQAGIFECDTFVTVSGEKVLVGKDYKHREIWSWVNAVDDVTMGNIKKHPGETTNSWLNTQIFINAIKMLVDNGILWDHDWTVKADPDAVIFPVRIRKHIIASGATGTAAFYKNCFHDGKWWLYGSIEMFSKEAMQLYRDAGERECELGMSWKGWGEDFYMAECMQRMGATAVHSGSLSGDEYCVPKDCADHYTAAFHPYKNADDWRKCYEKTMRNVRHPV